jgi:Na+/H+-dicarboxylate symporter
MQWPLEFLALVICLSAVAIVVPWIIPLARRGVFGLIAAIIATAAWVAYENHLHSIARPGDPLIRVDLLLIAPLIALDWVSAIASIAMTRWRGRIA